MDEEQRREKRRLDNIMAQRRFRKRKKEYLHSLEQQVCAKDNTREKELEDKVRQLENKLRALETEFEKNQTSSESSLDECGIPDILDVTTTDLSVQGSSSKDGDSFAGQLITQYVRSTAQSLRKPRNHQFRDEKFIFIGQANILQACVSNAQLLQSSHIVLKLEANSIFCSNTDAVVAQQLALLPENMQPTAIQQTVDHHPVVDLLPWPLIRDRMISVMMILSVSIKDLIYDIESPTGGLRCWGTDYADQDNWEISQEFADKWWFVMDQSLVKRTNWWRRQRGLHPLQWKGLTCPEFNVSNVHGMEHLV